MPCFENVEINIVLQKFRDRFCEKVSEINMKKVLDDLIYSSYNNFWTNKYDYYQKLTNGIIP
jgi:phosphatidylinositol kinase/protein kinase (PI-3  family)